MNVNEDQLLSWQVVKACLRKATGSTGRKPFRPGQQHSEIKGTMLAVYLFVLSVKPLCRNIFVHFLIRPHHISRLRTGQLHGK